MKLDRTVLQFMSGKVLRFHGASVITLCYLLPEYMSLSALLSWKHFLHLSVLLQILHMLESVVLSMDLQIIYFLLVHITKVAYVELREHGSQGNR